MAGQTNFSQPAGRQVSSGCGRNANTTPAQSPAR